VTVDWVLRTEGVTKRFGGLIAVDAVSLDVAPGSIFGLIGPNGAGKTTLFNMLAGAMRPDGGRVHFNGRDVTGYPAARMCELGLTRTFQNPRPFCGATVLQNAMVGGIARGRAIAAARGKAEEALSEVGLWYRREDLADILPLGQLKRLEIARCLATDPQMLLLDEPTGGLSSGDVDQLAELIARLPSRGLTLVVIEHNMRFALTVCGTIAVLNFGHVIASGSASEVARDPEVIRAYLGDEPEQC
jgi:branched-chain amino acid transport system ATP-binding protein